MDTTWDCIIVGAGAAGLSAALVLGRARRRTLVLDDGAQSNLPAHGIGGLLGHDGRPPRELYELGRGELERYPTVEYRSARVVHGSRAEAVFELQLADGTMETSRRVLLATGMDYHLPELPGIERFWGRSVFHCPFCHGWEARDQALGVLDPGETGVHRSLLLRQWSDDITLFRNGPADLSVADVDRLRRAGVAVDERRVVELSGAGTDLRALVFDDGSERACAGLLVPVTLRQRSALGEQLGATAAPSGPVAADAIRVDPMFQTEVPGLFAAGDTSSQMPSVANAIAAGSNAAAMVVQSLLTEMYDLAAR